MWFFGPDRNGIGLEVMGIENADGSIYVLHADKVVAKHRPQYDEVMRCQNQ